MPVVTAVSDVGEVSTVVGEVSTGWSMEFCSFATVVLTSISFIDEPAIESIAEMCSSIAVVMTVASDVGEVSTEWAVEFCASITAVVTTTSAVGEVNTGWTVELATDCFCNVQRGINYFR